MRHIILNKPKFKRNSNFGNASEKQKPKLPEDELIKLTATSQQKKEAILVAMYS